MKKLYELYCRTHEGTFPIQFSFNREELEAIANHLNGLTYMDGRHKYLVQAIPENGDFFDIKTFHYVPSSRTW